ncbi:hypothetical protein H0H81_008944, partial [Sphagnurus paluster]
MSDKVYEPIPPPTVCEADPRADLSDVQLAMYKEVLDHFSVPKYEIPGLEKGELIEAEKFWLSYECLLRYLRAVKWKCAAAAIQRLEATLKWRREYGIYEEPVSSSHVEPEAVTGKQVQFGYDVRGRPGLYLFPSRQNTDEPTRQIQFTVWNLERTIELMGPGVETLSLLINYGDKAKNPSLGVARTVLNILQDHYPERLGMALILNVPFLLNAFYRLINPFIDPVSREKMKFNPQLIKDGLFNGDMVMSEWWGGDCNFEYVHEKYWPALLNMCESRSKAWLEKWRVLGGTIGIKEWDYKGGATAQVVTLEEEMSEKVTETSATTTKPKATTPLRRSASASLPIRSTRTPTRGDIQTVFTLTTAERYLLSRLRLHPDLPPRAQALNESWWIPKWGQPGKEGEIFVFSNGSFVCWGLGEQDARRFAAEVIDCAPGLKVQPLKEAETEELEFVVDPIELGGANTRLQGDLIILGQMLPLSSVQSLPTNLPPMVFPEDTLLARYAYSQALSRSTALSALEVSLDEYLNSMAQLPQSLMKTGKPGMGRTALIKKLGELMKFRQGLNLNRENFSDVPDFYWAEPELERHFNSMTNALEVKERTTSVNDKITYAAEAQSVLRQLLTE